MTSEAILTAIEKDAQLSQLLWWALQSAAADLLD